VARGGGSGIDGGGGGGRASTIAIVRLAARARLDLELPARRAHAPMLPQRRGGEGAASGRRCGRGRWERESGSGGGSAEHVTKQGYPVDTHTVLLMSRVSSAPLLPNARIVAPQLLSISDSLRAMVSAPEQPHAPPLRPRAAHVARSHHHSARSTRARSPLPPSQPSPPRRRCPRLKDQLGHRCVRGGVASCSSTPGPA
jgi:hypothetical protein